MNAFDQYEVWFVTGAQLLYGGDAVIAVDAHSNEMVQQGNSLGYNGYGLHEPESVGSWRP